MDNVQNSLINLAVSKPVKQPSSNQLSEQGSFDKLMKDQQQNMEQSSGAATTDNAVNKKPAETVQELGVPTEQEMEIRIALAAMAVMQVPVQIQTNSVMQNEQAASSAAPIEVAVETVLTQENAFATVEQIEQPTQQGTNQGESVNVVKNQDTVTLNTPVGQAQQSTEHPVEAGIEDSGQEKMAYTQQGAQAEAPLFREVETVPIQVSETITAEKAVKEPVSDQLAKGIENALKQGGSKLELELEPKNLGRVKIEMILQEDGSMRVLLHAEKPHTQLLLQRDAGDLQALLGRTTQQEVQVEASQQQQQQFNYNGHNGHEQQQQQEQRHQHEENGEDFLHQLRLGLIDEE